MPAHYLVLFTRCKKITNEILTANGCKYLEIWSNLTKNVVESFLLYLYSGISDLDLITPEDLESAIYLCKNYPMLEQWKLYIKRIIIENNYDQTP